MDFYLKTDRGRLRSQNEDAVYAEDVPVGILPNLFVLADGMGGYKAGDYASKHAIDVVVSELQSNNDSELISTLQNAISTANYEIHTESVENPERTGMGTTMVLATIEGSEMTVANVGDSRLYLFEEGHVRQITHDHSYVEEMLRFGRINEDDAKMHPKKHYITRAIGAEEKINVDFFEENVHPGDRVLLCSDGLTNMVPDVQIEEVLAESVSAQNACETLIELANRHGGTDNISVIVIDI